MLFYDVLDALPTNVSELKNSVLATKTPYNLKFSKADHAKIVYVAACWVNQKGKRGPISKIFYCAIA
jgi:hypothetical protein